MDGWRGKMASQGNQEPCEDKFEVNIDSEAASCGRWYSRQELVLRKLTFFIIIYILILIIFSNLIIKK